MLEKRFKDLLGSVDKQKEKDTDLLPDLSPVPPAGVDADAWDRHWAIVSSFSAARGDMTGVKEFRYSRIPGFQMKKVAPSTSRLRWAKLPL